MPGGLLVVTTVFAGALALAACSTPAATGAASTSDNQPAANAVTPAGTTGTTVAGKVSANTATEAELTAALTAAGVPNAGRWAREFMEYRPYDKNDPALAKLRQNLTKYNPGDDTMNKILGALTP